MPDALKQMKIETSTDTLRNWAMNLRYFVCRRSNGIGRFFLVVAVIVFFIYFGPDIFGG